MASSFWKSMRRLSTKGPRSGDEMMPTELPGGLADAGVPTSGAF
jgi:hypothetical protein